MRSKLFLTFLLASVMLAAAFAGAAISKDEADPETALAQPDIRPQPAGPAGLFLKSRDGVGFTTSTNSGPAAFLPGCVLLYTRTGNVRLTFEGADLCPPAGAGNSIRTTHYIGNAQPREGCASDRIVYKGIWQGIDLEFFNVGGNLKYQYVLDAGASPQDIKVGVDGATGLRISPDGSLVLCLPGGGKVLDGGLKAFYTDSPDTPVRARFSILDRCTYSFELGQYDKTRGITIDPMIYSALIGGSNYDNAFRVAVDELGNAYMAGTTKSSDLEVTPDALNKTWSGSEDMFFIKISPDGKTLYYLTYLGGADSDFPVDISLDEDNNVYITGQTYSEDFPTTPNAYDRTYNGNGDTFVLKLDPSGKDLLYSTYMGGSADDGPGAIVVEKGGYVYVSGHTNSTDFPTSKDAYMRNHTGLPCDSFVFKLNPSGSNIIYSTMVGGKFPDGGRALAVDTEGHAYVAGGTKSPNFPTTPGAYKRNHTGTSCDFFIYKLNLNGSKLEYSTLVGGTGDLNRASGILVAGDGSVYVCGETASPDYPMVPGCYDTAFNGGQDIVVIKLDPTGGQLLGSTFFGGGQDDGTMDMCFDNAGNVCITGNTNSSDLPTTKRCYDGRYNGMKDVFVIKFNPALTDLLYCTYQGTKDDEWGCGIASDKDGNLYVCGEAQGEGFPITPGVCSVGFSGGKADAFIFKLNATEEPEDTALFNVNTMIAILLIMVVALTIAVVSLIVWQRYTAKKLAEEEAADNKKGRRGYGGRAVQGRGALRGKAPNKGRPGRSAAGASKRQGRR